jgi:hypothetical protein
VIFKAGSDGEMDGKVGGVELGRGKRGVNQLRKMVGFYFNLRVQRLVFIAIEGWEKKNEWMKKTCARQKLNLGRKTNV